MNLSQNKDDYRGGGEQKNRFSTQPLEKNTDIYNSPSFL